MERQSWRGWCVWGGWRLAIGNIEDLAGAMVQRDEAREGGGREGEERILLRKVPSKVRISSNGRICT